MVVSVESAPITPFVSPLYEVIPNLNLLAPPFIPLRGANVYFPQLPMSDDSANISVSTFLVSSFDCNNMGQKVTASQIEPLNKSTMLKNSVLNPYVKEFVSKLEKVKDSLQELLSDRNRIE